MSQQLMVEFIWMQLMSMFARMEYEKVNGDQVVFEIIKSIHEYVDGIHMLSMGDVKATNDVIAFTRD